MPTRPEPDHGTRARYQRGCKCGPCMSANRTYQRVYRSRRNPGITVVTPGGFRYRQLRLEDLDS